MSTIDISDHKIVLPENIAREVTLMLHKIRNGEIITDKDLEFLLDSGIALKYQDIIAIQLIGSTNDYRLQFQIAYKILRNTLAGYSFSDLIILMYISRLFPDSLKYFDDLEKFIGPPRDHLAIATRPLIAIALGLSTDRLGREGNSGKEIQQSRRIQVGRILN